MRGRRGEMGEAPLRCFLPCHMEPHSLPPESRGSAELHHSLFSDFMLWCFWLLVAQTVFGAAQNTCHPFIHYDRHDAHHGAAATSTLFCVHHHRSCDMIRTLPGLLLPSFSFTLLTSFPVLVVVFFPSLPILLSSLHPSPLCSTLGARLFALVPSLLLHHQLLAHGAPCNHICTTSCQFDRIHASFSCHLRRKKKERLKPFVIFKP